ncbi:AraC family transcriptional regulator [Marinobacterium rhizophilum]|uniref:AraC family transcriptional regulator n=1 Tax=Marinobacterium rhizophilum TaxID=420402 RepID=A0ABY5HS78_9GAMM|nr:AraC family transcriptional regulator [Marinobacterium rhizophilum]UTW14030.1 AraC family transcriptional regulator [Marinobacterium rhizophilum]
MNAGSGLSKAIAARCSDNGPQATDMEGLVLYRQDCDRSRFPAVYEPSICVIAQGYKRIYYGEQGCTYNPDNYLISSLTLPVDVELLGACADVPYLGLSLAVDRDIVGMLMQEMEALGSLPVAGDVKQVISTTTLTSRLQQCFVQLLEAQDDPVDRAVLAPVLQRQIYYEVLKGPYGYLLRNCVTSHAGANRIAPVVHYIEANFHEPLDIEGISRFAGMSASSLHEHFKQATSMSPMQFVKSLRLHRARTLLLGGSPASDTSYQVGYSSPSQFSREFKRFFGELPRDVRTAATL